MGRIQGDRKQECQNISAAVNMSGTWKIKMKKRKGRKKTQEKKICLKERRSAHAERCESFSQASAGFVCSCQ